MSFSNRSFCAPPDAGFVSFGGIVTGAFLNPAAPAAAAAASIFGAPPAPMGGLGVSSELEDESPESMVMVMMNVEFMILVVCRRKEYFIMLFGLIVFFTSLLSLGFTLVEDPSCAASIGPNDLISCTCTCINLGVYKLEFDLGR